MIRQGEDLTAYTGNERGIIAAGQIRAADAAPENHIPAKKDITIRNVEHHMPASVARGVANFKLVPTELHSHTVKQVYRRLWAGIQPQTECGGQSFISPEPIIIGVQRDGRWRAAAVGDSGRAAKMIEVGVSKPYIRDAPVPPRGFLKDYVPVPGRIDHHGFTRVRVADQVGIRRCRTQR